jgi:ABC-type sulfate transport system permease subunit
MRLPPILKRLLDAAIAIGLTMALVLVMVVISNLLVARSNSWAGFKLWYTFMSRPDILGTIILTALVSMGYVFWQQQGNRPR